MVEVFAIWLLVIFNIYLGSTEFYIFREKKVSRGQKTAYNKTHFS